MTVRTSDPGQYRRLAAEGKDMLAAEGVDVHRLPKLKSILLRGRYRGVDRNTFVNRDPDTVLVLGKGFDLSGGKVYSMGPVLAVEDANLMTTTVVGADLVWFVENSIPGNAAGAVLIAGPDILPPAGAARAGFLRGDYGWRRPDDFLKPLKPAGKPADKRE
jgi:hypothetical protein